MLPQENVILRDFIYFDFAKAASIFSQIQGGFVTGVETKVEEEKDQRKIRKYDLKVFKPEFGGVETEKRSLIESKILYHDLYAKVEEYLFEQDLAVDISQYFQSLKHDKVTLHEALSKKFYIRTEGWAVLEDYQRINNIADRFKEVTDFIGKCVLSSLEQTPEYRVLQSQIKEKKTQIKGLTDRNVRTKQEMILRTVEEDLENRKKKATSFGDLPDWLLKGTKHFIDAFMPNRINLMIYPFDDYPQFHVIANLKRDCFMDTDLENVLFAYGYRPNIKLAVFGLITSLPMEDKDIFDPMGEFIAGSEISGQSENIGFEKGIRGLFSGFEGIERMVRFSRFPNVTIYPIALYRNIKKTTP